MLAYAGMLEKKRRENKKQTLDDPKISAGFESFDQFYIDNLISSAKHKPREIDYEALKFKSPVKIAAEGQYME
jgi:hypothetical protein